MRVVDKFVGYFAGAMVNPSQINSGGSCHLLVVVGDSVVVLVRYPMVTLSKRTSVVGGYETEKEGWVCLIIDLHLFWLLVSQIFDAFFESSNLFLIILAILGEFLSLSLLTRFNILFLDIKSFDRAEAVVVLVAIAVAVADAVKVLVAVVVPPTIMIMIMIMSRPVEVVVGTRVIPMFVLSRILGLLCIV